MSSKQSHTGAPAATFAVLRGTIPDTIARDLETLASFPAAARAGFLEVLKPGLEPSLRPQVDQLVEAFARRHDLVGNRVAEAIRGCRYLVYEAAKAGAERHALAADIEALAGANAEVIRDVILAAYEATRASIREEVVRRTVLDHGALLTNVDWRVDKILASQHGRVVGAQMALLTLTYREGEETRRVTLHCEPAMLARLKQICDELV